MVIKKDERESEENVKKGIDYLFSISRDLSSELKSISEYYSFIANKIDPKSLSIDIQGDLIQCFEAVYLLLMDKLQFYPDTIKNQIADINQEQHVCQIMAVAGSLEPIDLNRIKFRSSIKTFADLIPFIS